MCGLSVPARLLCLLTIAVVWARVSTAEAGDPRREWKTVETEHFVIHYYEPLEDIGKRVAAVAERAHRVLRTEFEHEPAQKTQIVIVDDTDGANGFASVLPRNVIRLFATAPTAHSALNDHDDWLYGLTAHEYAHILHLDSIGPLPSLYNKLVGKTWAPNQVQPRWVIEGIATYQESRQSSSGRIRSALFNMNLRSPVLEGEELRLDQVTNGPRAWPRGTSAYLYGSHFLKYVFDRHGADKLSEMSWAYGSNPIPYGLNTAIEEATGETFAEMYDDWMDHLRAKYSMQKEAIERLGLREGRRLTFTNELNLSPHYSHDGAYLYWDQADGDTRGRYRKMPVGTNVGQATDHTIVDRNGGYDVMADGSLVVEQSNVYRTEYSFQELFLWDSSTDTMTQLTDGLRARDPAISPDERRVAFMVNGESRSQLAVMDLRPEAEHEILYTGPGRFDQVNAPTWSPDGRHIAFSAWRAGGYRDILVHDLDTGETTELMRDRALDHDPVYDPGGEYLYYVSDRTGIYNVFAYELATGDVYQVTNVVGGALDPDVSPDGTRLAYHGFSTGGWDVYEVSLDRDKWMTPRPYVDDRPDPTVVVEDEVEISEPRDYRALETLAPSVYTIQLSTSNSEQAVSIQTGGSDVVGIHAYSLGATVSLESGGVTVGGSYSYRRLWPSLRIAASRRASNRSGLIIDGESTRYTEENFGLTSSIGLPVFRNDLGSASINFDYDLDWLIDVGNELGEPDPNDLVPRLPETDAVIATAGLRVSYSDVRGFPFTLGPQEGQSFSASMRVGHPNIGSDFHSLSLDYNYRTYMSLPIGVTPTLSFRLAGGLRTTDRGRSGIYSLGGVPDQDIVNAVIRSQRSRNTGYLRGYEPRSVSGRQFHLMNLELRSGIWEIERGLYSLPFYLRRLHFAALFDTGNAFDGEIDLSDFKASVGGALRMDMVFGYFVPGSLELGYSRGLTADGIGEYWMLLTSTI